MTITAVVNEMADQIGALQGRCYQLAAKAAEREGELAVVSAERDALRAQIEALPKAVPAEASPPPSPAI